MADRTETALSRREREALADISKWSTSPYIWKQASMLKLEERGFVRRTGHAYGKAIGYQITPEGRMYCQDRLGARVMSGTDRGSRTADPMDRLSHLLWSAQVKVDYWPKAGCRCMGCYSFRITWDDDDDKPCSAEGDTLVKAVARAWDAIEGKAS